MIVLKLFYKGKISKDNINFILNVSRFRRCLINFVLNYIIYIMYGKIFWN